MEQKQKDESRAESRTDSRASYASWIRGIVAELIDDPGKLDVQEVSTGTATIVVVRVPEEQVGQILGREGKTAEAIRHLLACKARREKRRAMLEIPQDRAGYRPAL